MHALGLVLLQEAEEELNVYFASLVSAAVGPGPAIESMLAPASHLVSGVVMRRCYLLVGFICAAAAFVPAAAAQSSVGSSSCSDYRNATDPNQQALYAAYLQAYANAHSPDPRYTMSDAALTDEAKKVRDWCGKNTKRTYGEAVSAILGSASAGAAAAPVAPQPAAGAATYQTIPARKDRDDGDDLSVGGGSGSCLKTAGAVRANELVRRCLKVSPATHPPCNTENSCSMIRDEIKRGCALLGAGAPEFCEQYR